MPRPLPPHPTKHNTTPTLSFPFPTAIPTSRTHHTITQRITPRAHIAARHVIGAGNVGGRICPPPVGCCSSVVGWVGGLCVGPKGGRGAVPTGRGGGGGLGCVWEGGSGDGDDCVWRGGLVMMGFAVRWAGNVTSGGWWVASIEA